jgi:outer membrane biosynthesis protein TonB
MTSLPRRTTLLLGAALVAALLGACRNRSTDEVPANATPTTNNATPAAPTPTPATPTPAPEATPAPAPETSPAPTTPPAEDKSTAPPPSGK